MLARRGRLVASSLLLGCLAGCATKEVTVTTITPSQSKNSWIGRDMDDVLETWGSPSEREPDGRGGAILIYDKTVSTLKESQNPVDSPGMYPEQTTPVKRPLAKFWVDASRKVYRIEFADEVYEKGRDLVPPSKPESP
jgi:hypothetical protein